MHPTQTAPAPPKHDLSTAQPLQATMVNDIFVKRPYNEPKQGPHAPANQAAPVKTTPANDHPQQQMVTAKPKPVAKTVIALFVCGLLCGLTVYIARTKFS